jgi:hypothetical protein
MAAAAYQRAGSGTQTDDGISALIGEAVHLFLDDVRGLTHAAHKEGRLLENRRLYLAVAVEGADVVDALVDVPPVRLILRQDVQRAPRCSILHLLLLVG